MILGFGILSIAHFWPEILRIKVIAKIWHFCVEIWQLSDTNRDYLGYDTKFANPLLLISIFHHTRGRQKLLKPQCLSIGQTRIFLKISFSMYVNLSFQYIKCTVAAKLFLHLETCYKILISIA